MAKYRIQIETVRLEGSEEIGVFILTHKLIALGDEGAHVNPAVSVDAGEGLSVDYKLRWGGVDLCALAIS